MNWVEEVKKFLHGPKRVLATPNSAALCKVLDEKHILANYHIVIVTYDMLSFSKVSIYFSWNILGFSHISHIFVVMQLHKPVWQHIVWNEIQTLKNDHIKCGDQAQLIKTEHTIGLSGLFISCIYSCAIEVTSLLYA
jgi:SNF2 family DNA or RNA helicase